MFACYAAEVLRSFSVGIKSISHNTKLVLIL